MATEEQMSSIEEQKATEELQPIRPQLEVLQKECRLYLTKLQQFQETYERQDDIDQLSKEFTENVDNNKNWFSKAMNTIAIIPEIVAMKSISRPFEQNREIEQKIDATFSKIFFNKSKPTQNLIAHHMEQGVKKAQARLEKLSDEDKIKHSKSLEELKKNYNELVKENTTRWDKVRDNSPTGFEPIDNNLQTNISESNKQIEEHVKQINAIQKGTNILIQEFDATHKALDCHHQLNDILEQIKQDLPQNKFKEFFLNLPKIRTLWSTIKNMSKTNVATKVSGVKKEIEEKLENVDKQMKSLYRNLDKSYDRQQAHQIKALKTSIHTATHHAKSQQIIKLGELMQKVQIAEKEYNKTKGVITNGTVVLEAGQQQLQHFQNRSEDKANGKLEFNLFTPPLLPLLDPGLQLDGSKSPTTPPPEYKSVMHDLNAAEAKSSLPIPPPSSVPPPPPPLSPSASESAVPPSILSASSSNQRINSEIPSAAPPLSTSTSSLENSATKTESPPSLQTPTTTPKGPPPPPPPPPPLDGPIQQTPPTSPGVREDLMAAIRQRPKLRSVQVPRDDATKENTPASPETTKGRPAVPNILEVMKDSIAMNKLSVQEAIKMKVEDINQYTQDDDPDEDVWGDNDHSSVKHEHETKNKIDESLQQTAKQIGESTRQVTLNGNQKNPPPPVPPHKPSVKPAISRGGNTHV